MIKSKATRVLVFVLAVLMAFTSIPLGVSSNKFRYGGKECPVAMFC